MILTPLLLPLVAGGRRAPDPFRDHHGGQSEHRHVHAAVRAQPVRLAGDLQAAARPIYRGVVPFVVINFATLMLISYVPVISMGWSTGPLSGAQLRFQKVALDDLIIARHCHAADFFNSIGHSAATSAVAASPPCREKAIGLAASDWGNGASLLSALNFSISGAASYCPWPLSMIGSASQGRHEGGANRKPPEKPVCRNSCRDGDGRNPSLGSGIYTIGNPVSTP